MKNAKNPLTGKALPEFDRQAVFAEVDASNRRFEHYTKTERESFAEAARASKAVVNETCRTGH